MSELTKAERKLLKAQRKAEKNQVQQPVITPANQEKITVLCVRFGTKYGREYVERLRNMVARHLTVPYEFVCLTDDPYPIEGVRNIIIEVPPYKKLWWCKVHMFDPSLPISGRILYLDLDVVICNNIDKLVTMGNSMFYGIRDFNRKFHPQWNYLNSSVLSWTHQFQSIIWDKFKADPAGAQTLQGDQDWIWKVSRDKLVFWPDEWIQSYKWEIRNRSELTIDVGKRKFKNVRNDVTVSPNCCIAVFHGDPNPDAVTDSFVLDNWK